VRQGRGSSRACHTVEGEGEKERGRRGVGSQTAGLGWLRAVLSEVAARAHDGGGLANRPCAAVRLTGEAGRQRGLVVSGGVQKRAGEKSRAAMERRQAGPGSTVLGGADSDRI
jgi:hypothetical protein